MSWIKRMSRTEIEEAGLLADQHTAEELDAESARYGRLDHLFRRYVVPSAILPAYAIILLREYGIIATADAAGFAVIGSLLLMLVIVMVAREVWYRWCVVELALLLRQKRDARARSIKDPEASLYAINE